MNSTGDVNTMFQTIKCLLYREMTLVSSQCGNSVFDEFYGRCKYYVSNNKMSSLQRDDVDVSDISDGVKYLFSS